MTPYLTDAEIESICRPRKQGAAQVRYLRDVLRLPVLWARLSAGIFPRRLGAPRARDLPRRYPGMGAAPIVAPASI